MIRNILRSVWSRAGPAGPAAVILTCAALAVAGLLPATASAISVITVDGFATAGEWDEAEVVIWDPNETDYTKNQYDVKNIYLTGGWDLNMRVDVYQSPVTFKGLKTKAFLNFYFTLDADPGATYCLTINDGFGYPKDKLHLARREGTSPWVHLGEAPYALGDVFEAQVPWSLFPAGVIPEPGDEINLNNFTWVFESGNTIPDDYQDGSIVQRNDPLPIVPEPLTAAAFVMGCAGAAWRWRNSRRGV